MKSTRVSIFGFSLAAFFAAIGIVSAWTGPTASPPSSNVAAPINVSATSQVKNGNIGINGLAVFGNSILQGSSYLNWGSTAGSSGYGIRDNAGTLEFKNSGGSWSSLQSTIQTLVAGGQWATSGNNIYNANTGNVGIGTNNPTQTLQVNGPAYFNNNWGGSYPTFANSGVGGTIIGWNGGSAIDGRSDFINFPGGGNGGFNFVLANSSGVVQSTPVTIKGNGNVGIGTSNPAYKLDVYAPGATWKAYFHGPEGGISIGPLNTSFSHIYNDNGNAQPFIFNTDIYTTTNGFSSYNGDLLLKRAGATQVTVGSGAVTLGAGSSSNWAQLNIPGPYSINAAGTIYSYSRICVGNNSGGCDSTGGVVIQGNGVKFPDGSLQTTAAAGISGSGSTNYVSRFTGATTLGNSSLTDDGSSATANGNFFVNSYLYDGANTAYYLKPSSASNVNVFTANDFFANNWFRVNGSGGIYWQQYGGGWYMQDSTWIRSYNGKPVYLSGGLDTGAASGVGCGGALGGGYTLQVCGSELANNMYDRNDPSFYVDPNAVSILNDVRASILYDRNNTSYYLQPSSVSMFNDARANIFYDRNNTNYYVQPSQTTNLNALSVNGGLSVSNAGGAYTYITLHDDESPNGVKYIHANSNLIGFLNGAGNWMAYWDNGGNQYTAGNITVGGGNITGLSGGVGVGSVSTGWYSDGTNLAARIPNSSGALYVQGPGGGSTANLIVTGSATAASFLYSSDERLKKDIAPLTGNLAKVLAIQPVSYLWKDPSRGTGNQIGFIAQNVQQVEPELVHTDASTTLESVDYARVTPLLVGSVQELNQKIEDQQKEIDELRQEIEALKK